MPLGEQTYRFRIARSAAAGISNGVQQFEVALEDRMTVLDALFLVQRRQDPSISFRCACRVGMCGTCAMSIDGVPRLACKTRVRTLATDTVHVAPLPNLPVVKDLVVSLEPFFDQWKRTLPKFRPPDPSCNPYLALAAMLKTGLDGIRNRLPLPEPADDRHDELDAEGADVADPLPATLGEALEELNWDPVVREALGQPIFERFLTAKEQEWQAFGRHISSWELSRYLEGA